MKVGDLIRDNADNEIGLVVSVVGSYNNGERYIEVLWPRRPGPLRMSMSAYESGWVELINESR